MMAVASGSPTEAGAFTPFGKIARLKGDMVITEKIDGTNAAVGITEDGDIYAQSRNRIITPGDDNFGFARWVEQNKDELAQLGPGVHFGEWWGVGIQRGYDMFRRRFSLFNTGRWGIREEPPACCDVVPVLYRGEFDTAVIDEVALSLQVAGSVAAPGFGNPEGVMIYLERPRLMLKHPFDPNPKGEAA